MRKEKFVDNFLYHIYNRGVEKRDIFLDNGDYARFIHYLYVLNDQKPLLNLYRFLQNYSPDVGGLASHITEEKRKRELLVKIHCFCLMPNHFHLILEQLVENGITKFMQKLGTAYTMFFNTKYKRTGRFFQGTFKAIPVENDEYFLQLMRYIHLNPLELKEPDWKIEGIANWKSTNKFLKNYRWSSYLDYIGKKNFPSVSCRDFGLSLFPNQDRFKKFTNQCLIEDFDQIKDIAFE